MKEKPVEKYLTTPEQNRIGKIMRLTGEWEYTKVSRNGIKSWKWVCLVPQVPQRYRKNSEGYGTGKPLSINYL